MIPLGRDKEDNFETFYCMYCGCVVKLKEIIDVPEVTQLESEE
jgi:hypothetical protein